MRVQDSLWFWRGVWGISLLIGLGIPALYGWLPVDGATGDLGSFTPQGGFRVQWLLEEREEGLRVGDVIVRAGGHTVDEWLAGASRGPEWRTGGIVIYEVLRNGRPLTLEIQLAPIPFRVIVARWMLQLLGSVAFFSIGTLVFWKRPRDRAVRALMLFCVAVALQYWGDAYNFQYGTLPWRWPFWLHLLYEHGTFSFGIATICYFALIFPDRHPLVERFPRLSVLVLYASHPLIILGAMVFSPGYSGALRAGTNAAWVVATLQIGLAIYAGIRSARIARDPVARAQMRWIAWSAGVGAAVLIPGYILPLVLGAQPLFPHPVIMVFVAFLAVSFAIAILRYRLFDIEIIINRSLVYGTLTVVLAGFYLLLVGLLTLVVRGVLQREDDTLVVFIATLSIALAAAPLRRQVQRAIDRTFYRTKVDYQRLLPEMSAKLATSIVPGDLAALLTVELPQRLQIASATLAVLDVAGDHIEPVGDGDGFSALPVGHPLIEHLRRLGNPLLRLQPPFPLHAEAEAFLDQQGVELSIPLIAPLTGGTELVGVYNLGPKLSGDAYNRYEVRLLHLLGQQAAVAVENSRLFQAERELRMLAEALQEAAAGVSSTLDLDQVLDRILEQVEHVVAGDAFNIMRIDGSHTRVIRWRGYERLGVEEQVASLSIPITDYPTLMEMIREGEPIVVPDTAADPRWVSMEDWVWLYSYVAAPIRVGEQTVGFLNVDGTRPGQFGPADARRLEAFANHAAAAIENAQLYQEARSHAEELTAALVRLQELDHLKSEFIQNVSHELRSPLAIIRGYAELLNMGEVGELRDEQKGPIGVIARRARMLSNLVQDITLILEAETSPPEPEPVHLDELAHAAAEDFQVTAGQAGLTLRSEVEPRLPPVKGTQIGLRRVLDNLIGNAVKFTSAGGTITVQMRREGEQVVLEVSDTGIGIAADQLECVFDRFYQVDGSTKRRYGGMGLGLALVKEIVEAHAGTVGVESELDVGTTFTVVLPIFRE